MTSFLRAQDVIHVEDIIAVLVVVAIVLGALAGLCQDSARVPRRLVLEARVADAICGRQMGRQSLERLMIHNVAIYIRQPAHRVKGGGKKILTLMKPPSGFARLKRGWRVFLGCSSLGDLIFLNSGTVLMAGGFWRRGAFASL